MYATAFWSPPVLFVRLALFGVVGVVRALLLLDLGHLALGAAATRGPRVRVRIRIRVRVRVRVREGSAFGLGLGLGFGFGFGLRRRTSCASC